MPRFNKTWPAGALSKNKFKSKRFAGIEWEHNHGINFAPIGNWEARWKGRNISDSSCGYESVTPPLAGDNIEKCLRDLGVSLNLSGTTADDRCSVHVHIGVQDFDWTDMYRLIEVYCRLEPLLYSLGGDKRAKNNRFCKPIGKKYEKSLAIRQKRESVLKTMFEDGQGRDKFTRYYYTGPNWKAKKKAITATEFAKKAEKKDGGRYKGLNIIPWVVAKRDKAKDCTVEFRIHENTLDADRVIGWTHLLVRIVDWCKTATKKDIAALPVNSLEAIYKIAPESKDWVDNRISQWKANEKKNVTVNKDGVFIFTTRKKPSEKQSEVPSGLTSSWYANYILGLRGLAV